MTKGLLTPSRRSVLKGIAGTSALAATGFFPGYSNAQSSEPIKLGFPTAPHRHRRILWPLVRTHRGSGAEADQRRRRHQRPPGRDRSRMTVPIPQARRRSGRQTRHPVELRRRSSARSFQPCRHRHGPPRGELKVPYLVCSEGHHVAIGHAQPLDDAARHHRREEPGRQAMAPFVSQNSARRSR
jgi:branched-chain amino acid transport system substrate-binding protein